jgi:hypothetical protein
MPMRGRVLDALIVTSGRRDALSRLFVGPSLAGEVVRNTRLLELPASPAVEVYTGPLHRGLDAGTLSSGGRQRAAKQLVIASALWGALRPTDRIPSYRLHVCSRLIGMDRLEPMWRAVLPDVLATAAGPHGAVLDLRSPSYQAIGKPSGLADRTVTLNVRQDEAGSPRVGDVIAKRVRGQAARHLLESNVNVDDPETLAEVLGERWPVQLQRPPRPGSSWAMTLFLDPTDQDQFALSAPTDESFARVAVQRPSSRSTSSEAEPGSAEYVTIVRPGSEGSSSPS